jgi:hypothetical protein
MEARTRQIQLGRRTSIVPEAFYFNIDKKNLRFDFIPRLGVSLPVDFNCIQMDKVTGEGSVMVRIVPAPVQAALEVISEDPAETLGIRADNSALEVIVICRDIELRPEISILPAIFEKPDFVFSI